MILRNYISLNNHLYESIRKITYFVVIHYTGVMRNHNSHGYFGYDAQWVMLKGKWWCYFMFLRIENSSKRALALFAFFSAIATNTRVVGGILLLLGFVVLVIEFIRKRRPVRSFLFDCLILFLVYGVGWVLISPVAWSDPIGAMIQTLRYFSAHPHPLAELYFGTVLTSKPLPWHYLPVWMGGCSD